MSIAIQISRIQSDRNTIRAKLVELGLVASTATLDACAEAIASIINQGSVNASVKEGESYTIPAGYHDGSGTVAGVAGGGNYQLQSKTVTPTKKQQAVNPDAGYYGLSGVTVEAIPELYQDVSSVTALEGDVLTGKIIVKADGTVATGTMANNGKVTKTLDAATITYTIPKGFHNGEGAVTIVLEQKTVTPSKSAQEITPTSGKVLSKVTVDPIPDAYQDVSDVTTEAAHVLDGDFFVDKTGAKVGGTMPNNGAADAAIDGLTQTSVEVPAGYTTGGTVSLTSDIEDALAAI